MSADVTAALQALRIIPVIVIDDPADAVPLARALADGGLRCAEITFRTSAAVESIRRIASEVPDLLAGAGTVLSPQQVDQAHDAGARFMVAPGFNPRVVAHCRDRGIPVYPGVCTPTEIEAALEHGLDVLKFFPAEPAGGLSYLKAMAAPYTGVRFIPTGGVNAANIGSYLAFSRVVACGGSWMAPQEWIAGKQFDRIRDETRKACDAAPAAGDKR